MKISLIGMSGTGKSYWSKKLVKGGFQRFCCDDIIEKKLGTELTKLGYHGIEDVAKWMGQPFSPQYQNTSKKYLQFEQEVLEEILKTIQNTNNIVIDTTGSVIYLNKALLEKLVRITKIVYLETPHSVKEEMFQLFMKEPKPVIWGDAFKKQPNETNQEALKRCYPEWLEYRSKHYAQIADVTLDYFELRKPDFTLNQFLHNITT